MRTIVRNSFARHTIRAERVRVGIVPPAGTPVSGRTCHNCGGFRANYPKTLGAHTVPVHAWLYRFYVEDDQGSRHSGPIADGKLFCTRDCCESYIGHGFDETE